MGKEIIVGGGLGGLLLAQERLKKEQDVQGFEPSERLGGRFLAGVPRFLEPQSLEELATVVEGVRGLPRDGQPHTRKKGAWTPVDDENFPLQEEFLLTSQYYLPNLRPSELVEKLTDEAGSVFHLRRRVVEIVPSEKRVRCDDDSQWEYERLFWCADLEGLRKASTEALPRLNSAMKNLAPAHGGLCLDWELSAPLYEGDHTAVFPFRFKDWKLRTLGVPGRWEQGHSHHWYLFLEEELLEDREEVAKCVRALKRELGKEFPESKNQVLGEKLSYFPIMSCEKPAQLESLEVTDGLWYLGPEAGLGTETGGLSVNLDLVLSNFRQIQGALADLPA